MYRVRCAHSFLACERSDQPQVMGAPDCEMTEPTECWYFCEAHHSAYAIDAIKR